MYRTSAYSPPLFFSFCFFPDGFPVGTFFVPARIRQSCFASSPSIPREGGSAFPTPSGERRRRKRCPKAKKGGKNGGKWKKSDISPTIKRNAWQKNWFSLVLLTSSLPSSSPFPVSFPLGVFFQFLTYPENEGWSPRHFVREIPLHRKAGGDMSIRDKVEHVWVHFWISSKFWIMKFWPVE